jgi:hypothetical protein
MKKNSGEVKAQCALVCVLARVPTIYISAVRAGSKEEEEKFPSNQIDPSSRRSSNRVYVAKLSQWGVGRKLQRKIVS